MTQDSDEQDDDNYDDNINMDKYPEDPPVIYLELAAARGKFAGVPHQSTQWNYQEWPHQKTQCNS